MEKTLPGVPWSKNTYTVMQRCIPSYAPVLGFSLISSGKRRVGFNGSWKTYLQLGLKREYLCMHSCSSDTVVGIRATLGKWSWAQHPFLSQCTAGHNTCSRSGAFADCQDVTVRKAAGVDKSQANLVFTSQKPTLSILPSSRRGSEESWHLILQQLQMICQVLHSLQIFMDFQYHSG